MALDTILPFANFIESLHLPPFRLSGDPMCRLAQASESRRFALVFLSQINPMKIAADNHKISCNTIMICIVDISSWMV